MKIALVTNLTTAVSLPVLKALSKSATLELCHVLFLDTLSQAKRSSWSILREQGLKGTVVKASQWMACSTRKLARERFALPVGNCRYSHEYAEAHQLPFSVFADLNQPAVASLLERLNVDILLVCSCRQILKSNLMDAPRIASINMHPSLLPKYRGPVPVFWSLYHGDAQTGITFHLMTEQIDDGDVIAQFKVPINSQTSELDLSRRLFETAAAHVEDVLLDFVRGHVKPQPQSRNHASYQSYPTARQRRQLFCRPHRRLYAQSFRSTMLGEYIT